MHASYGEALPINEFGMRRFELLVEKAERQNVNIVLENMRKTSLIVLTANLLEKFNTPQFGFCFDSGHHNARVSKVPEHDLLSRFGDRLMALHLHDNDGIDDQHRLPFDGITDWSSIMKAVVNTGYINATALEVKNLTNGKAIYVPLEGGTHELDNMAEEAIKIAFEWLVPILSETRRSLRPRTAQAARHKRLYQ